jgi:tRNA(adenine34) deaminase
MANLSHFNLQTESASQLMHVRYKLKLQVQKMNITDLNNLMSIAIDEAKNSLREGNSGFGALIVKDRIIIAQTHDTDTSEGDPTAHAELKAIKIATAKLGKDLKGCVLVSTHEPCPMCSSAALWANIDEVAFGYSIKDALKQGRKRIDITLEEIYNRGNKAIKIHNNILIDKCSVLYNKAVRENINILRNSNENSLKAEAEKICTKRIDWFQNKYKSKMTSSCSIIDDAYKLFLTKLGINEDDAPVVKKDANNIVIHSKNFCPTLEACQILNLDTRFVCRHYTEKATDELIHQLHPDLHFSRNYNKIRPYSKYCEEIISFDGCK